MALSRWHGSPADETGISGVATEVEIQKSPSVSKNRGLQIRASIVGQCPERRKKNPNAR